MLAPNRRFPALPRLASRPALWLLLFLFSASTMLFLACAGGTSSIRQFFAPSSAEESSAATFTETPTPSPTPTPVTSSSQPGVHKKSAREVHIAVEKASQASESAAQASAKALQASKQARQAADAASQAEAEASGTGGSGKSIVSLEAKPIPSLGSTPGAMVTTGEVPVPTPTAQPKGMPSLERGSTAAAGSPTVESSGERSPANAAKLIDDIDKIEKRIDRNNLSADESERDILAQRLLQGAKKALADGDNVAAISLATKASTLLAPLPKLPTSANRSMR